MYIDSDYMLVVYTTMWFVRNDENDEIDDVQQCRVHIQDDDEMVETDEIDEKFSFDISDKSDNEQLTRTDENDDVDELLVEVETIDSRERIDVLDVVWFAK